MPDSTVSYATPPDAIRVFCGFPRPELTQQTFFSQLGNTFMPGTPYMLQPLGLAAYLPGVLSNPPAGLPHEFALICYPSVAVWDAAMNNTLRGRVYNQTHGGVYAMPPSGASFPVFIDQIPPTAADPVYLFDKAVDWQAGATRVGVAGKADPKLTGTEFRIAVRKSIAASRAELAKGGIDQSIVMIRDDFLVLWAHTAASTVSLSLAPLSSLIDAPTLLDNQRVVCRSDPLTLTINDSSAYNFIFLRASEYFLA